MEGKVSTIILAVGTLVASLCPDVLFIARAQTDQPMKSLASSDASVSTDGHGNLLLRTSGDNGSVFVNDHDLVSFMQNVQNTISTLKQENQKLADELSQLKSTMSTLPPQQPVPTVFEKRCVSIDDFDGFGQDGSPAKKIFEVEVPTNTTSLLDLTATITGVYKGLCGVAYTQVMLSVNGELCAGDKAWQSNACSSTIPCSASCKESIAPPSALISVVFYVDTEQRSARNTLQNWSETMSICMSFAMTPLDD